MVKEKKVIRRYRRFCGYDYSRGAALFITIVTNPRRRLFGKIVGAKLQKTPLGLAVEQRFAEMAQMPGIRLFNFVVMPDHVHLQLHLRAGLANPLVTLGRAIGAFKSLCAKDFHELTGEPGAAIWTGTGAGNGARGSIGASGGRDDAGECLSSGEGSLLATRGAEARFLIVPLAVLLRWKLMRKCPRAQAFMVYYRPSRVGESINYSLREWKKQLQIFSSRVPRRRLRRCMPCLMRRRLRAKLRRSARVAARLARAPYQEGAPLAWCAPQRASPRRARASW